ncbi:helix-turn-helix domain-containing protein [Paenibacillus sp. GCM10023248]|uniref:response regulator transcription factor n=1 Tax=Bacillales TaxID=1385 RepID=UPI002379E102|nr:MULTISPECIES: helix-turn-helix domain-containing protein [Bacillales]MDD9267209.1 helix-turn-helix domain-containing protein [Paenibacillus sp. MAHUQ-63]MDR6881418.1 YesN/AraC family two-component response regulator [Bacillus sp. 3255]
MKICVADDEQEVRHSIVVKLSESHPHANVFDVGYGLEALEQIKLIRPELVFLDIRMPELDGLDMLAKVMHALPKTKVVMLTGYSHFEYAKKAVHYGASDYLLKPADVDELKQLVHTAYDRLSEQLAIELSGALQGGGQGTTKIQGTFFGNVSPWFDDRVPKSIVFEDGSNHTESHPNAICGFDCQGQRVLIVPAEPAYTGGSFRDSGELSRIWPVEWKAWETKRFYGNGALHSGRYRSNADSAGGCRLSVVRAVKTADREKLDEALSVWMQELQRLQADVVREECAKLVTLLDSDLTEGQTFRILEHGPKESWLREAERFPSWQELKTWLLEWVMRRFDQLHPASVTRGSADWFDKALSLLEQRADMDITLESLAAEAGVHPVTLSRMFKQQTGLSFIRYLTKKRMEKAKRLLASGDQPITKLAESLGYQDHRYFTTLFKNEWGMTPGDFRKLHGSGCGNK